MKINISPKQWHVSGKTIFYMFLLLMVIPLFNGFALLTGDGGLHSPYYFVGYSTGFGARKLLGTIFSFILPEYTTHRHLVPYIWCVLLAIFLLFANYVSASFRGVNFHSNSNSLPFLLLTAVYVATSYSVLFCYSLVWYADIWLYLLTLIFITLFAKFRSNGVWPLVYGVIVIIACLIHHIFCCLFFPLFVALFIYEIFDKNKLSVRLIVLYGVVALLLCALFICLWFFSSMNIGFEELGKQLSQRANSVCCNDTFILTLLYGTSYDSSHMYDIGQFPARFYQLPFLLLLVSPLISLFVIPWILCIRKAKNRVERTKYILMLSSMVLLFFPVFIMATDYGRWLMAWFFCHTILLLTMYRIGDSLVIEAMSLMYNWCKRHIVVSVFLIVYILLLRIYPTDNAGVDALSYAQYEIYANLFAK